MSTSGGGGGSPTGAAGGDLAGSYPNPSVAQINTSPLGTTTGASAHQALAWSGTAWAPGSALTTGTAGGDLSGTYPNPTVAKVNGVTLGTIAGGTTGNVLTYNGTNVVLAAPASGGAVYAAVKSMELAAANLQSSATTQTEIATFTNGPGTGSYDLSITCAVNDLILLWFSIAASPSTSSNQCYFDMESVNATTFVSGLASTGHGVNGWQIYNLVEGSSGAPYLYKVVSGDITAGAAKFRPTGASSSGTMTILSNSGSANSNAQVGAINLSALATGA